MKGKETKDQGTAPRGRSLRRPTAPCSGDPERILLGKGRRWENRRNPDKDCASKLTSPSQPVHWGWVSAGTRGY